MATQTDKDWLLDQLSDGRWHPLSELLRHSLEQRGHGLTVHSRVSDLRKDGHRIECEHVAGASRGNAYQYRLVQPVQASPYRHSVKLWEAMQEAAAEEYACVIDESAGLAEEIPGQLTIGQDGVR